MIRPFTLVCMLLACGSGLYLYQAKHRVLMLDRQISMTVQATTAARDRAGMLRTEWAQLNEPERLRTLADQYLQLKPLDSKQFVALADLGNRLPPPRVAEAEPEPDAPALAGQQVLPVPAVAVVPPPATVAPAIVPVPQHSAVIRPVAEANARPAERRPAPVRVAAAPTAGTPRLTASVVPIRAMASVTAAPLPTYVPMIPREMVAEIARAKLVKAPTPMVASALGMARNMVPPPVPVASPMSHDGN